MEKLLKFLLENITGEDNFTIEKKEEEDRITFDVSVPDETIGLVIGKGGRTIKAIQDVMRVKGRLEDKSVFVNVEEK